MLQNTFCHINGIGKKTEARLWKAGITRWQDWREPLGVALSKNARMELPDIFEHSREALEKGDCNFFSERLPSNEQWRLFKDFRTTTAYLDIETTGLGEQAEITTIALYDGDEVHTYVNGRNLDDFMGDVEGYNVLVSYNGKGFDIPFLERHFRCKLPQAQIDLRFVLAKLGFKGGLKGCERQLGINRGALDGVDGYFAVLLWDLYERQGDEKALTTLLAYNVEDTVNLERLLVEAWNRNISNTPFAQEYLLPCPQEPRLDFQPDLECVERLRRQYFRG